MLRVRLILDPFDLSSYSEHETDALIPFIQEQFAEWPTTARLYRETVSQETDVTPISEGDIERLEAADEGLYYVVIYPADPVTAIIIAVAVFVVVAVALIFLMPRPPGMQGAPHAESSNNSIGNRVNKPRPNERIPDIFGKIKAVPELLTVPLLIFQNNREFEICYMAVGRGEYEIDPDEVYDGQTPLDRMAGAAAEFYAPFTRPGNGDPFIEIGGGVGYPLKNVIRLNEVNGQKLRPPNANKMAGEGNIKFVYPASIVAAPSSGINFAERFAPGDDLTITNAVFNTEATFDATSQICRFYPDKRIEFQTFDPSTIWEADMRLVIYNGFVTGDDGSGNIINIDVSGTYTIVSVNAGTKIVQLA